jgi:hypothetical protein
MAIYRVLRGLSCGNKPGAIEGVIHEGSLTRLEWLKPEQIDVLMEVGAVSRAATPPLVVLPGWKLRAEKMRPLGIVTAEDVIEANTEHLAKAMGVKPQTAARWQAELKAAIVVSAQPPTSG